MTQTATPYAKPLPLLQGTTKEFYEYCRKQELRFQRCKGCGKWRHVPRERCAACGSWEWEWAKSAGRGKVFTWTVVRRPMHPAFKDEGPYAPVVIEMDEGVRLVSWVVNCPPEELRKGMPVEVAFDAVTPEVTLPKFRRV
ncbi:MAG: OB-fold domain-containing protein [Candidatus Binatia bacterium]